jgi:hypothetical protein
VAKDDNFIQRRVLGDKMERYFHNEPDDQDDGGENIESFANASKQDIMDVMQLELVGQELNQKLMDTARHIASSDWTWIFLRDSTKLRRIEKVYKKLRRMTSEE